MCDRRASGLHALAFVGFRAANPPGARARRHRQFARSLVLFPRKRPRHTGAPGQQCTGEAQSGAQRRTRNLRRSGSTTTIGNTRNASNDWWKPFETTTPLPAVANRGFLDLFTEAARPYDGRGSLIFNTALYRTELARSVRFDEGCHRASDNTLASGPCAGNTGNREIQLRDDGLTLWLCHDQNISNPRHKRRFITPLAELKERIGEQAWADTSVQLTQLRERLPSSIAPPLRHENRRSPRAPQRENPWAARRHGARRPIEPFDDLRPLPIPAVIARRPQPNCPESPSR